MQIFVWNLVNHGFSDNLPNGRQCTGRNVAIMLSCFGDESSDETKQRVFTVVGVVGSESQWAGLEPEWVARCGGLPFHAKDCESDHGDYKGTPHRENQSLYKDLTTLLANSGLVGYGFAIDLMAQKEVFPEAPDFHYYKGFLQVLEAMYNLSYKHNETVKFTFDSRIESEHNAALLYRQMIETMPEWKARFYPELSFACSREHPKVQVADLMARESMKILDNRIGPVKRRERKSWIALASTNRFLVDVISKEWFQDLKDKRPAAAKAWGMEDQKYYEWLRERGRIHNMTNMFLWMHSTIKK